MRQEQRKKERLRSIIGRLSMVKMEPSFNSLPTRSQTGIVSEIIGISLHHIPKTPGILIPGVFMARSSLPARRDTG